MLDRDDFVVGGLDAGDLLDHGLDLRRIAAGGNEGNVVFPQIFTDQPPGVAGHAIDDDGALLTHVDDSSR